MRSVILGGLAAFSLASGVGCSQADRGKGAAPPVSGETGGAARAVFSSERLDVGAPQSAAFDAAGNLWMLDGPRLGVLRRGEEHPIWTEGPGGLGRGALGTTVCGGGGGEVSVLYAATLPPGEAERFVLADDGGRALPSGTPKKVKDCERACAEEDTAALPAGARPTRCLRDGVSGALWMGTLAHGLWRRERDGVWTRLTALDGRWVRALAASGEVLVVVTERGLFQIEWELKPEPVAGGVRTPSSQGPTRTTHLKVRCGLGSDPGAGPCGEEASSYVR